MPKNEERYFVHTIKCSVCNRLFGSSSVRKCTHPAVVKRYGENGKAFVCYYCCLKCKFKSKATNIFAIGCTYKEEGEEKYADKRKQRT